MVTLESPFVEEVDLRTAAALLADIPALLAASPIPEQRDILRGVFDRVWLAAHTISAIMPNRLYLPLASAAAEVCILGGPGGYPATLLSTLPPIRTFEALLKKAGLGSVYGSPTP